MSLKDQIWVEKYRPKTLEDLIIPQRVFNKFEGGKIDNHTLLSGSPGLGKTSLAKIIAAGHPGLLINCSIESGVDSVRNKITDFCSNISLIGGKKKTKVVILDEFDGVSDQYLKSMRGTIEKFASTTRFIATCNYLNKIPDNVQSRFDCIDFNFSKEDEKELMTKYLQRINKICKLEELSIEPKAMAYIVKKNFPDLRSTITFLQGKKLEGVESVTLEDVTMFSGAYKELYEQITSKNVNFIELYTFAYKSYVNNEVAVFDSLGKEFINYLINKKTSANIVGEVLQEVADYTYQSNFVVDKFISLAALLNKLKKITNE